MFPGTRAPEGQRDAGGSWPEARKQKSKNKGETMVFTATTSPPAKKETFIGTTSPSMAATASTTVSNRCNIPRMPFGGFSQIVGGW